MASNQTDSTNNLSYYLIEKGKTIGPFTIQELVHKGITKDTLVWSKELNDWKKAGEIFSISHILTPSPYSSDCLSMNNQEAPFENKTGKVLDILALGVLVYWIFQHIYFYYLSKIAPEWYHSKLWQSVNLLINIIDSFCPLVLAFLVRDKNLRIIAIIICALLVCLSLGNNIFNFWYFSNRLL